MERSKVLKLVIIGDGGVGKTTLVKAFCTGQYVDQIMTIGIDIHTKDTLIKGDRTKTTLQIWDISGQSQFKFLLPDFIRNANGVILAFDATSYTSFQDLGEWLQLIRSKEPNVPIFLIATKVDENFDPALNIEKVSALIKEQGLIGYEETSAKLNFNIDLPFKRLLENIYQAEPDTLPITFLGPERRSEYIEPKDSTLESPPLEPLSPSDTSQEPEILAEITSTIDQDSHNLGNSATSPSFEKDSRVIQFITQCPHCNAPLRESQIKLKADGKEVLCRNCLNMI